MKVARERDLKAIKYYQKKAVDIWNALLNKSEYLGRYLKRLLNKKEKKRNWKKTKNFKEITTISVEAV